MNANEKVDTPNFDRINPSTCVNAKLRRLHRILNGVYLGNFKAYGLQGSMLSILFIIGKMPGVNQKFIADRLVLDQSTMSRDLKKLQERGIIERRKGEDPRNISLFLTTKGYLLLEEVSPIWEKLQLRVEKILGEFNIQQIDSITAALSMHLEDAQ